jgi:transcriptional regulator with XRE-family HTH domain
MLTSEQIRGARAMLRIDQKTLADLAGISVETVKRLEAIPGPLVSAYGGTVVAIQEALEGLGAIFTNGDEPGVKLRKAPAATSGKRRKPARPRDDSGFDAIGAFAPA